MILSHLHQCLVFTLFFSNSCSSLQFYNLNLPANLKSLWTSLHFEVQFHVNKKKEEMERILQSVAALDHGNFDCLVVCVLSHGKPKRVYGHDGHTLKIKEFISYFHSTKCPTLADKPKVFFIQACQGTKRPKGTIQVLTT